jgi:hypothetical protein
VIVVWEGWSVDLSGVVILSVVIVTVLCFVFIVALVLDNRNEKKPGSRK